LLIVAITAATALVLVLAVSGKNEDQSERSNRDLKRRLERLRSVPYASVTAEKADPSKSGVLVHDKGRAYPGYNLYCSEVKAEAYLMDMSGKIVHTWTYPEIRPWRWRVVEMLDNGDLLVINKNLALIKLDWHSNLIWTRQLLVHHDVTVAPDNTMYILTMEMTEYKGVLVRFDIISRLDFSGEEIDRWRSYDHLDEIKLTFDQCSFLDVMLDSLSVGEHGPMPGRIPGKVELIPTKTGTRYYDYFHVNTINLLPPTRLGDRDPRFRAGNLLVCFRNVNQICVLDKDTKQILWVWGEGELEWPHHPVMLDNGNIVIFDNGVSREYSRIIEVNPLTEEIEWEYSGDPPQTFYSHTKGAAQRFPNGNTMICDSGNGRIFEVTREGEVVWEWFNPATKDDHRVQVFRMYRFPPAVVEPLLGH
jgi:hypothetical protein